MDWTFADLSRAAPFGDEEDAQPLASSAVNKASASRSLLCLLILE
jgi:hypothetical protein